MISILPVLVAACFSAYCVSSGSVLATPESLPATFQVLSNSSEICLLIQFHVNLSVVYTKVSHPPIHVLINSANRGKFYSTGLCSERKETLQLTWTQNNTVANWSLLFNFSHDKSNYNLNEISLHFELVNLPGLRNVSSNQSLISCPVGSFYSCKAEQNVVLNSSYPSPVTINLTVSQLKVEAFRNGPKPEFNGIMVECSLDSGLNKLVPTIIGISLAVMIVIALVIFIVTSQRHRIRGNAGDYQQI
ncbi:unnamed protein product [Trichobilharzia szidati]|nr:unnamed protein product [Trichobilharzia szidati]